MSPRQRKALLAIGAAFLVSSVEFSDGWLLCVGLVLCMISGASYY